MWMPSTNTFSFLFFFGSLSDSEALHCYWTHSPSVEPLERWWEINLYGPLIDECFLRDGAFNFQRTEAEVLSSRLLRPGEPKKADGVLLYADAPTDEGDNGPELLVMETSCQGDTTHAGANLVKEARILRMCVSRRIDHGCLLPAYGIIAMGM